MKLLFFGVGGGGWGIYKLGHITLTKIFVISDPK